MTLKVERPSWTARGFHSRVRMAKDYNLFIVTEGHEVDPFFYDNIARVSSDANVRRVKTYAVSQINRRSAGDANAPSQVGKSAVLAAFKAAKMSSSLRVENNSGKRSIVFCVDRDLTDSHDVYEGENHFCVTRSRDVEAEIFQNSDAVGAIQHLLSIDRSDSIRIVKHMGKWQEFLAVAWREWILLSAVVIALPSAPSGVNWTEKSLINDGIYGPVDTERLVIFEEKVIAKLGSKNQLRLARIGARRRVRQLQSLHGRSVVVKGKWYPAYLEWLLQPLVGSRQGRIQNGAVLAFAGSLDYDGEWSQYYRNEFEKCF